MIITEWTPAETLPRPIRTVAYTRLSVAALAQSVRATHS
jgi:hypothetical protein